MSEVPPRRRTKAVTAPAGARRRRQVLDEEIRASFAAFLDHCRRELEIAAARAVVDADLRQVARLLDRKAQRDSRPARPARPGAREGRS